MAGGATTAGVLFSDESAECLVAVTALAGEAAPAGLAPVAPVAPVAARRPTSRREYLSMRLGLWNLQRFYHPHSNNASDWLTG